MPSKIYFTTTLPYVNADPHLGFAFEVVMADILARYYRRLGREVFFNTGTDEHGLKIYRQALAAKQTPPVYTDQLASRFQKLKGALNLSYDRFTRTTDPSHLAAAQEFWRRCQAAGDIYKKNYQIKYCVGCELEKTDSELDDDYCLLHPTQELEIFEEENYFFRFSRYQGRLLELYNQQPDFVIPTTRLREIQAFVKNGLQDFSISRLVSKMPWGIPVPDDPTQTIYVWFDALINYISAIGWPDVAETTAGQPAKFYEYWPVVQFAGKDNLRQQAAMWQAMLLSVGLPPSKQIVIHGFITSGGQKMSKSLGNIIDPFQLVEEYGPDAVRYFLARHVQPFEDTDVTPEKFKEVYNANLANGLGNLVSRVMKMASTNGIRIETNDTNNRNKNKISEGIENFELNQAMDLIWQKIGEADLLIQQTEPFKLIKTDRGAALKIITDLCVRLYAIGQMLEPFMPHTAKKIQDLVRENKMPAQPLFQRK